MGLIASVYRSQKGDFSNGGLSSEADEVCIANAEGPFDPDRHMYVVVIVPGPLGNPTAFPAVLTEDGEWVPERRSDSVGPMAGGAFIATTDSRFSDLVGFYGAVPLHDRFETPAQYEMNSL